MIMSEKQTAAVERKQRICDRYKGADTAEVEVIPAKPTEALDIADKVAEETKNHTH